MNTTDWYIESETQFAFRRSVKAAIRRAMQIVADDQQAVTVKRDGKVVGYLTEAGFWTHVTDERLAAAIERIEE